MKNMSTKSSDNSVWGISEDAVAHFDKGFLQARKGQFDSAIGNFSRAIEIHPTYTHALLNRGLAYHENGQFKKAIQDYNRIIEFVNGYLDQAIQLREKALEQLGQERGGTCTRFSKRMIRRFPFLKRATVSIPLFCWAIPLIVSVIVASALCQLRNNLYAEGVGQMSGLLVSFLGVTIAILIAVLTPAYVQGRGKQITGFSTFVNALREFKMLISKIEDMGVEAQPEQLRGEFIKWRTLAEAFAQDLDDIKPAWDGYDHDTLLESKMVNYVNLTGLIMAQHHWPMERTSY